MSCNSSKTLTPPRNMKEFKTECFLTRDMKLKQEKGIDQ